MKKIKIVSLLFIFLLAFVQASSALAHPIDVYTHNIYISIAQDNFSIKWEIKPGPLLIQAIWFEADKNQDGVVDDDEANQWLAPRLSQFNASREGTKLPLNLDEVKFPASVDSFQAGEEYITIYLSSALTNEDDVYTLIFYNHVEEQKSLNWYYITVKDGIKFQSPKQSNSKITIQVFTNSDSQTDLLNTWDSSMPSLGSWQGGTSPLSTPEPAAPTPQQNANLEKLLNLVRTKEATPAFYIFALLISLALGALHALTPGHGKTVVAAYLVGSRGTTWHAIVLGTVVTLTHTGSVFLLGVLTLVASQYILPTTIIPLLEILSGLLIVGLGFYLLWQRFLYWRNSNVGQAFSLTNAQSKRKISLTPSFSTKKISGKINIQKPSADLHHHGDGKYHSHTVPKAITWRSLITLGISGGLVPCPDAIAILLVAIAINRIILGLALIISFSLGLAIVLIVIGLLMVNSSRLFKRIDVLNKFAPIMPMISAGVVLILGFGLTYGAITKLGDSASPLIAATSLGSIDEARIIYLDADENDRKQLFIIDTKGSEPYKLTNATQGVVDFAISPDQKQVVYIERTEEIEYDFWLMDLNSAENRHITSCKEAECGQPVWAPDGQHVIYEYMAINSNGSTLGISSLWSFDIKSGEAQPVFQEDRLPGTNPRWSPNGEWLSYATPEGLRLYNLASGENRMIKNTLRAAAQWSPDSKSILMRDVVIKNDQFVTQLFLYDLSSETLSNLNANENMENILAAWSPDGKFISVVRRDLSNPRGDQIWIMRANGSDAHAVTDAPAVLHGNLSWSPDGKYLLYDLYLLDTFPIESRLEMLNMKTGDVINLEVVGYNPRWVWRK